MSWTTSTWDWLTGADKDRQAKAYYAKENQVFHKLVLSSEKMDAWKKTNTPTAATRTNEVLLQKKINDYKARQTALKSKAAKTQPMGYLETFKDFISKWVGINGVEQVGVLPLIPIAVIALTAGGAYIAVNYIEIGKQAEKDEETIDKLLKIYEKTGDPKILTAVASVNAKKDEDETSIFGKVVSTAKTVGNVALWGGLAVAAIWLFNNQTVRSGASFAASQVRQARANMQQR